MRRRTDPRQRFARYVTPGDPMACWEWHGGRVPAGYGLFRMDSRRVYAHRAAWALANSQSIPPGLVVMHICDNPPCVNPAHLRLGTQADNVADRDAKGHTSTGHRIGVRPANVRLTPEAVRFIRSHHAPYHPEHGVAPLARKFGVAQRTVRSVLRRESWRGAVA